MEEEYHNIKIKDPYQYLEDSDSRIVRDYIKKQNEICNEALYKIKRRKHLFEKLTEFDQKNKFVISKLTTTENNYLFYLKRLSNENIPKLYYKRAFDNKEILLYDSTKYKPQTGTEYIINYIQPNWDGSKVVVSLTSEGKEISELIIIDVTSKKVLPKILTNAWPTAEGGIHWLPDNSGFIYLYHPVINKSEKGFLKNTVSVLHKLSNNTVDALPLLSKKHNPDLDIKEEDFPSISVQNSTSKFLIGKIAGGLSYYDSYYLNTQDIAKRKWKPLFTKSDQVKSFVIQDDSIIYRTSKNGANFKICITSIKNPDFNHPKVLVHEYPDQVITDFDITSEGLYFVTNKNGVKAHLYQLQNTKIKEIKLPNTYGHIAIHANRSDSPELWINAHGWTTENKHYQYQKEKIRNISLNTSIENEITNNLIVEEIEVLSHDGKKIPLSLIYNNGIKKNHNNYIMMDSYGAFGISMKPAFSVRRMLWIAEGGIYAIAHVRGGGEKGDAWHKGGYKSTKSNTWKDFISCADFLIKNKYTTPKKLAIWSGSAGGILIGRAITERPDLFAAAIIEFGTLNMIRYLNDANGLNVAKEFGTITDPEEFKYILDMDAYHHIKKGKTYPATLLTAGLNDPRVPTWNTIKFNARIQIANTSNKPNYILIDSETGHAQDEIKNKEFEKYANIIAFALWQTGHPEYQPEL